MILKKASTYIKISIILIGIILISIMHFWSSNFFETETLHNSNIIKLLKSNEVILQKINVLTNATILNDENIKTEILYSADIYEYTLSSLITGKDIFENGNNLYVSKPNSENLQDLKEVENTWYKYNNTLKKIINNGSDNLKVTKLNKEYKTLVSIQQEVLKKYDAEYEKMQFYFFTIHLIAIIIYLILSILLFFIIKNKFIRPIEKVEKTIDNITNGKTLEIKPVGSIEYDKIHSKLGKLYYKTNEISNFVNQLVNDDYEVKFKEYNKNDSLELSLVKLRDKLKENIKLNEERLSEEKLRKWFTDGQAKFNDILRESSSSIDILAESSLKNLVKYFNAAQGGFFIIKEKEGDEYLELTSAFAYDRVKALNKTIPLGEGLVGMSALEKNTIWLNNIPEDYMEIESGLGEAPPTNLIIVPLRTDENILGVIEIASFYEFSKNEVEFIENIAEDIASTLETTKITDKTSILLEESQKKSDELAARDSEMSDKLIQLREAQKETKRSETEMTSLISAVDKVLIKIELNITGKINSANQLFLKNIDTNAETIRRKNLFDYIKDKNKELIDNILKEVKNDKSVEKKLTFISENNNEIIVNSLFSPVKNEQGRIIRVLFLANDISDIEKLTEKNKTLLSNTEEQKKQLLNIDSEAIAGFNKLKIENEKTKNELKKYIKIESAIKAKRETKTDKKYKQWLNSFKS